MEPIVALSTCLLIAALSALGGWLLGEMRGASRMRRFLEADDPDWLRSNSYTFGSAETSVARPTVSLPKARITATAGLAKPESHDLAASLEPMQLRRSTFDNMPSLAELSEQAAQIRRDSRIWDDPEMCRKLRESDPVAARLLRHYQQSIDQLIDMREPFLPIERQSADGEAGRTEKDAELPRISALGPISPHTRAAELAEQRRASKVVSGPRDPSVSLGGRG